jgi:hypothetical protein
MDATLHPLAIRFASMIEFFCKMMGRDSKRGALDATQQMLATARVQRMGRRFAALVARWLAGTLPLPGAARKRAAAAAGKGPRPKGLLPSGKNWFRKMFGETAPMFAGNLLEILHGDPQMMELAAATPLAGRVLRPMCWMLGVKPPEYLQLPLRPRKPRPPRPPRARKPKLVNSMSRMAWANLVNPADEGAHDPRALRPPNRIGYGRQKRLIKPG